RHRERQVLLERLGRIDEALDAILLDTAEKLPESGQPRGHARARERPPRHEPAERADHDERGAAAEHRGDRRRVEPHGEGAAAERDRGAGYSRDDQPHVPYDLRSTMVEPTIDERAAEM